MPNSFVGEILHTHHEGTRRSLSESSYIEKIRRCSVVLALILFETIETIGKKYPSIKIIAMSGGGRNSPETYLIMAKKMGAHVILTKPFDYRRLVDAIIKVIEN